MRLVLVNGEPTAPEKAVISVFDRGFLYGDAVFETIRTYGGRPFALDEHMARLQRSADRVFITLPLSTTAFADETRMALQLAGNPESYLRVMVTRGEGPLGLDPSLAQRANRVIFVEPLVLPPVAAYRDGIAVVLARMSRSADETAAAGAKVANYLVSLLALREAKRAGAAEALIVDRHDEVLEGTTSNVFMVKAGVLVTPPEHAGILPGITREHLIFVARRLGMPVELRPISCGELRSADEVFISSSIREILAVVRIDADAVGGGTPGPVTRRLHAEFRTLVGAVGPLPW